MKLVNQSNVRVWQAMACVRVLGRDASTMGELRDALVSRSRSRSMVCDPRISLEIEKDIRAYGRQERTLGEIMTCL